MLSPVQLQSGVLGHAIARRLHDLGWRAEAIDEGSSQRLQSLGLLTPVVSQAFDEESITTKVEKFCQAARGMLSYGKTQTSGKVHFSGLTEIQKWLNLGHVDFAELFRGFGEAAIRVREAGMTTSEGFDKYAITYERCWHLNEFQDQCDCAWILVHCLQPLVKHLGTHAGT